MSKHTPGSWRIGKHGSYTGPGPKSIVADTSAGHDRLGVEYYGGHLIAESIFRDEDASLIAAAPDLLAACEEMHARYGHRIAGPHNTGSRPDICFLCAAIAKARGES